MNKRMGSLPVDGFTLVELMMVLAILSLLLMTALPAYQYQLIKTRRVSAQSELLQIATRQEHFFVLHKQYASKLELLGYPSGPYAIGADGQWLSTDSSDRIYLIGVHEIDSSAASVTFKVSATPQLGQLRDTQCGVLAIDSSGVKTSAGTVHDCW